MDESKKDAPSASARVEKEMLLKINQHENAAFRWGINLFARARQRPLKEGKGTR